ncbi:TOM1-like protein 6 [Bidens hawaiensis]|uniref:TOM1-like protein 6 n=1 Tax=Bidens hawaiensis TaxID=980011 RepID=UPI00404B889F
MIPMLPFSPPPSVLNAYARVDKATSDFLSCPDWRINIGICDTINSKPWLAKDYIKAVRTRLQHKNPNVQLLALTLLETIVKNCSEHVHSQIAERKILQEMIKIVKKKSHMRVREKILALIEAWQEAFRGQGGKITAQYFLAYEELRCCRVEFPNRPPNTVPVVMPPVSYGHHQAAASSSTSHEPENMVSLSNLESMRDVLDLLYEMLQAVDPKDRQAVKDEVIIDLYDQCRSNQKKLVHTLSSTTDEDILNHGLQFNEALQYVIEKHDAIASGSPVPDQPPSFLTQRSRVKHVKSMEVKHKSSDPAYAIVTCSSSNEIQEEEPKHYVDVPLSSRLVIKPSLFCRLQGCKRAESLMSYDASQDCSDPLLAMTLVPADLPVPTNKKTEEEDMINLLTLALSPAEPSTSESNPTVVEPQPQAQPPMNSYVVPWAQTHPQLEYEPQPPAQPVQHQPNYILPQWAPTPGYYCNPYASTHPPSSYYNGPGTGESVGSGSGSGSNQYVPSYRLFEDLNIFGNVRTSATPGTSGPSMLGARK